MILPDWRIEEYAKSGMIKHFTKKRLSSYGYDMTLSNKFLMPRRSYQKQLIIDPKTITLDDFEEYEGKHVIIPPNSFVLGKSVEYFSLPREILAICLGRSTYARCGIITNVTPLEPEWEGVVTIEISNTNQVPAKVYADEGISQAVFLEAKDICKISYRDKKGRYQNQVDITLPSMGKR